MGINGAVIIFVMIALILVFVIINNLYRVGKYIYFKAKYGKQYNKKTKGLYRKLSDYEQWQQEQDRRTRDE